MEGMPVRAAQRQQVLLNHLRPVSIAYCQAESWVPGQKRPIAGPCPEDLGVLFQEGAAAASFEAQQLMVVSRSRTSRTYKAMRA